MLNHFRQTITEALAQEQTVTLSTFGPAGLQAGRFPCEADGMKLYILVPGTVDLLQNMEQPLIATSHSWQVHGMGRVLSPVNAPSHLALLQDPDSRWCALVEIQVRSFSQAHFKGWGFCETVDVEA